MQCSAWELDSCHLRESIPSQHALPPPPAASLCNSLNPSLPRSTRSYMGATWHNLLITFPLTSKSLHHRSRIFIKAEVMTGLFLRQKQRCDEASLKPRLPSSETMMTIIRIIITLNTMSNVTKVRTFMMATMIQIISMGNT